MVRNARAMAAVACVVVGLAGLVQGESLPAVLVKRIPAADLEILGRVADEYGLTGESRLLLYAIRIQEGGDKPTPGLEMGVKTPKARRFAGNYKKSLELQAQYAAGTVQKRFTGDLPAFADRWCPLDDPDDKQKVNQYWLRNVRAILAACQKSAS